MDEEDIRLIEEIDSKYHLSSYSKQGLDAEFNEAQAELAEKYREIDILNDYVLSISIYRTLVSPPDIQFNF